MARIRRLIHFGDNMVMLADLLRPDFTYVHVATKTAVEAMIEQQPLLRNGELNPNYRNDLFLVSAPFTGDQYGDLLKILPAHQVLRSTTVIAPDRLGPLEQLKDVFELSLNNPQTVASIIKTIFVSGQSGAKVAISSLNFSQYFMGAVEAIGNNYVHISQLKGESQADYQYIGSWTQATPLAQQMSLEVTGQYKALNPDTDVMIRATVYVEGQTTPIWQRDIENEQLFRPQRFRIGDHWAYISFALFAKGPQIDFNIGTIHIRQSRENHGVMMVGGHSFKDQTNMGGEVLSFFDSGDLKPPLNVYFSGYRPGDGFEGNFMMRNLNAPFLIFSDPRLEGGSFYTGTEAVERQIVSVIDEALTQLGFTKEQLILSGLSMGTFGALYYAAKVVPHAVLIGKPLTNVGRIAMNGRLARPNDFDTAKDILLNIAGGTDQMAAEKANQQFWETFKKADFSHTIFAISYMQNDDYDDQAFTSLNNYLGTTYPQAPIFHKGIIGRHNDDTNGIVEWFLKQYRNILSRDFHRE